MVESAHRIRLNLARRTVDVDLLGLEGGLAGGIVGEGPPGHRIDVGDAGYVVVRVLRHLDAFVRGETAYLERAGAAGMHLEVAELLYGFRRHDCRANAAELGHGVRIGLRQPDGEGAAVRRGHIGDAAAPEGSRIERGNSLEAVQRVVGDDFAAVDGRHVLKADTRAHVEDVGQGVRLLKGLGVVVVDDRRALLLLNLVEQVAVQEADDRRGP